MAVLLNLLHNSIEFFNDRTTRPRCIFYITMFKMKTSEPFFCYTNCYNIVSMNFTNFIGGLQSILSFFMQKFRNVKNFFSYNLPSTFAKNFFFIKWILKCHLSNTRRHDTVCLAVLELNDSNNFCWENTKILFQLPNITFPSL